MPRVCAHRMQHGTKPHSVWVRRVLVLWRVRAWSISRRCLFAGGAVGTYPTRQRWLPHHYHHLCSLTPSLTLSLSFSPLALPLEHALCVHSNLRPLRGRANMNKVAVAGHSFGAATCLAFAQTHRVLGVVAYVSRSRTGYCCCGCGDCAPFVLAVSLGLRLCSWSTVCCACVWAVWCACMCVPCLPVP